MAGQLDPDALPFRIDLLYVCRPCGRIYGDVESTIPDAAPARCRQRCDCQSAGHDERRPPDELKEAVTLCRCCGLRPLLNRSRRSVWFCRSCCTAIQTMNRACGTYVIPLGRYTLLEQMGFNEDDGREVPAFVPALGDWFERVERLEIHAWLVMQNNLKQLGDESSLREVSLAAYLERLSVSADLLRASVFDLGRAFNVPPYLLSDAVRTIA